MIYRLLCFAMLLAVSSGVHAEQDDNYISREDRAVLDMFFCRHPHAELGKGGCVVMRPEDAQFRVPTEVTQNIAVCRTLDCGKTAPVLGCAPGYEQACAARDYGARPYQPYGGGR
jgi:hypothetical protein